MESSTDQQQCAPPDSGTISNFSPSSVSSQRSTTPLRGSRTKGGHPEFPDHEAHLVSELHTISLKRRKLVLQYIGGLVQASLGDAVSTPAAQEPAEISRRTIEAFLIAFEDNSITHLTITHAYFPQKPSAAGVSEAHLHDFSLLMASATCLQSLSFHYCKFEGDQNDQISPTLMILLSRLNQIKSLESLSFRDCSLSATSMQQILQSIPLKLICLDIPGNMVDVTFLSQLAEIIPLVSSLQQLNIDRCWFGDRGAINSDFLHVLTAIQQQINLFIFEHNIPIEKSIQETLQKALSRNRRITHFLTGKGKKCLDLSGVISSPEELELIPWKRLNRLKSIDLRNNSYLT